MNSTENSVTRVSWRIFFRLILIQTGFVILAVGSSGIAVRYFFKQNFIGQVKNQLHDTLISLSADLPVLVTQPWCRSHIQNTPVNLTVIAQDGRVLCSSHHDSDIRHLEMPEVLYDNFQLHDRGLILQGAIPLFRLREALHFFDVSFLSFLLLLTLGLTFFSIWSGRKIILPISRVLGKVARILSQPEELGVSQEVEFSAQSHGEWIELEASLDELQKEVQMKSERLDVEREEQATLMAAISDAVLAVDLSENVLFFNSRFALLFGEEEMRSRRNLCELFRVPDILAAFRIALHEGKTTLLQAVPFEKEEGRFYFSISVSPLRRGVSPVYGAVGVFHDVTELKRAEQIRIEFVANVSHELRTPLTAIKGYTDTLIQDINQGNIPQRQFLDIIQRNTERLMSLIHDLLDLSSIESGESGTHLQKVLMDAEDVTSRILKQMRGTFEAKKQKIQVQFDAKNVLADPRRLEQVLVNLLDNACKYTPLGGEISIIWSAEDEKFALLKIRDTGPGIPLEHQPRLFERFYRVDKARSRELGGTGLGLAIVKHIMHRHGGSVAVESALGHGTTFICYFPVK